MLIRRLAIAVVGLTLALTGVQFATAAAAGAAAPATTGDVGIAARTLYYDASRAGQFVSVFNQAAQVWNSSVTNVRLQAGSPASIVIRVDNGWPRTYRTALGAGTIYMGMDAVNQGYYPLRIATHELGHILGLPDRRTGLCSDLMSGSSAPVSCQNATPSSRERAEVNANFAGTLVNSTASDNRGRYTDCYI